MFASFFIFWAEFGVVCSILTNYPYFEPGGLVVACIESKHIVIWLRNRVTSLGRFKFEQWTINNWRNEINKRGINITTVDKESVQTNSSWTEKLRWKKETEKKKEIVVLFILTSGLLEKCSFVCSLFRFQSRQLKLLSCKRIKTLHDEFREKGKKNWCDIKKWNDKVRWCEYT